MLFLFPVTSAFFLTGVITTVREKVANSIGFPPIKGQSVLSCRGSIYTCCFRKLNFVFRTVVQYCSRLCMYIIADRDMLVRMQDSIFLHFVLNARWRGGATGRALDLRSTGRGFEYMRGICYLAACC